MKLGWTDLIIAGLATMFFGVFVVMLGISIGMQLTPSSPEALFWYYDVSKYGGVVGLAGLVLFYIGLAKTP